MKHTCCAWPGWEGPAVSAAEKAARAGSPARIVPGCSRWAGYSQPTGTMLGGNAVCIPAKTGKSGQPRP